MTVLILGCGWVGEAFAQLLKALGHKLYVSTTNMQKYHRLQADGISVVLADFDQALHSADFPQQVDYVLTSVPASKSLQADELAARFQAIYTLLYKVQYKKHIFLSSVGVYPDTDGRFTEDSEVLEDSHLRRAELHLLGCANTHVYRLGGLFGEDRVFAKYFQGRVCTTGEQPANFIHRDDVLQLILQGFEQELKAEVYNLVCPMHPTKKEVILASAEKYGYQAPQAFVAGDSFQKYVSGSKLTEELGYSFLYPSPNDF